MQKSPSELSFSKYFVITPQDINKSHCFQRIKNYIFF